MSTTDQITMQQPAGSDKKTGDNATCCFKMSVPTGMMIVCVLMVFHSFSLIYQIVEGVDMMSSAPSSTSLGGFDLDLGGLDAFGDSLNAFGDNLAGASNAAFGDALNAGTNFANNIGGGFGFRRNLQWGAAASSWGDAAASATSFGANLAGAAAGGLNDFANQAGSNLANFADGANAFGDSLAAGANAFGAGLAGGLGGLGDLAGAAAAAAATAMAMSSMNTVGSGIGMIVLSVASLIPAILFCKFWWSFKSEDTPVTRENLVKAMTCYLISHGINFVGQLIWALAVGGGALFEYRMSQIIPFVVLLILGIFWRNSAKAFAC